MGKRKVQKPDEDLTELEEKLLKIAWDRSSVILEYSPEEIAEAGKRLEQRILYMFSAMERPTRRR